MPSKTMSIIEKIPESVLTQVETLKSKKAIERKTQSINSVIILKPLGDLLPSIRRYFSITSFVIVNLLLIPLILKN
jgi:hypothetical protein